MIVDDWAYNLFVLLKNIIPEANYDIFRYIEIDRYLEARIFFEKMRKATADKIDINGFPLELEPPISVVQSSSLILSSYISATYAFNHQLYTINKTPDYLSEAQAIEDKLKSDAAETFWSSNIVKSVNNAVQFNTGPIEITVNKSKNKIEIESLDPYNSYYDKSVANEKYPVDAMYFKNTKALNVASIFKKLINVDPKYLTASGRLLISNQARFFSELDVDTGYLYFNYSGQGVIKDTSGATDWSSFSLYDSQDTNSNGLRISKKDLFVYNKANSTYAYTRIYIRSLPDWLGLPPSTYPRQDITKLKYIPVYKVHILGSVIIAVEPVVDFDDMMPIVIGAVRTGTNASCIKSFSELLLPAQAFNTKISAASIEVIRKLMHHRTGILSSDYENLRANINDPVVSVNLKYGVDGERQKLTDVFLPDRPDYSVLPNLMLEGDKIQNMAFAALGINPQVQGSRIAGNKTAEEVRNELTNATAPFQIYAMTFEQTCITPLKQLLKPALLSVADSIKVTEVGGQTSKPIDKTRLMYVLDTFIMTDPLTKTNTVNPAVAQALISMAGNIPAIGEQVDILDLFKLFLSLSGIENVDSILKPIQVKAATVQPTNDVPSTPQP